MQSAKTLLSADAFGILYVALLALGLVRRPQRLAVHGASLINRPAADTIQSTHSLFCLKTLQMAAMLSEREPLQTASECFKASRLASLVTHKCFLLGPMCIAIIGFAIHASLLFKPNSTGAVYPQSRGFMLALSLVFFCGEGVILNFRLLRSPHFTLHNGLHLLSAPSFFSSFTLVAPYQPQRGASVHQFQTQCCNCFSWTVPVPPP